MDADDNQHFEMIREVTVVAKALDERTHGEIELVVNRGIAAAVLVGIPKAMEILNAAGIPKNISLRVLNSKTRRRASDWR